MKTPISTSSGEPPAQGAWTSIARMAALSANPARLGPTAVRRGVALGAAVAGQLLLAMALIHGLAETPPSAGPPALVVSLLPQEQNTAEPPLQVMKPLLVAPQVAIDLAPPPLLHIYEPPPVAEPRASTALTASPQPAQADSSAAILNFQTVLLRHLNRHKRYPAGARVKREQGIVTVRFTMDRRGNLITSAVERGSRFALLNEESLALLTRAQPLPMPPREIASDAMELIVPVEFSLR